jgi:hypothetical protein
MFRRNRNQWFRSSVVSCSPPNFLLRPVVTHCIGFIRPGALRLVIKLLPPAIHHITNSVLLRNEAVSTAWSRYRKDDSSGVTRPSNTPGLKLSRLYDLTRHKAGLSAVHVQSELYIQGRRARETWCPVDTMETRKNTFRHKFICRRKSTEFVSDPLTFWIDCERCENERRFQNVEDFQLLVTLHSKINSAINGNSLLHILTNNSFRPDRYKCLGCPLPTYQLYNELTSPLHIQLLHILLIIM